MGAFNEKVGEEAVPLEMSSGREAAWRRCIFIFAFVLGAGLITTCVTLVAFDPYDSGRVPTFMPPGVSDESPRTANVSRGRDPSFNSVIIGNSHAQLIDPARLSSATGLSFVQMTVPGTGTREQMAVLRWFIQHHHKIGAIVIGADEFWCTQDPKMPLRNPFPFWLYGDLRAFVANSLNSRSFVLIWRRILIARGVTPRTDPAGYWDYELGREWNHRPPLADWPVVDLTPRRSAARAYPALDLLDDTVGTPSSETMLILFAPPRFRTAMPLPDSDGAKEIAACKSEILRRFSGHPRRRFVDFLNDTPENRDPENYMDETHYRAPIARRIEQYIAREISALAASPSGMQ